MNRKKWLKYQSAYEKRAFRIIRKDFRKIAQSIPTENLTRQNYAALIDGNISEDAVLRTMFKVWRDIGYLHGKRTIQSAQANFKNLPLFNQQYQDLLTRYIALKAGSRFRLIRGAFAKYLIEFIADLVDQGLSFQEIIILLDKETRERGFYRWQMARIARTESTAAANWGAIKAAQTTGLRLQKMWVSVQDERTRTEPYNHLFMDGVTVKDTDLFEINGDFLEFPGDPNGKAGNVINCRCGVAMIPYRDREGRLNIN